MNLHKFTEEQIDNKEVWRKSFLKSDIVFLDCTDYEQFKSSLSDYLFELRHSTQNLQELLDVGWGGR